jgi:hypothetical protein
LLKWVQKYSNNLQFKHGKYRKVLGALKKIGQNSVKKSCTSTIFHFARLFNRKVLIFERKSENNHTFSIFNILQKIESNIKYET